MEKENQRIALTKKLLQNAFLKLLKTTPIHAISIRELCREAGINRTTFYNHYGSQYDLLGEISGRFLDSIAAALDCADIRDQRDVRERVTKVLLYLQQNRDLSLMLLNNNIDPGFARRLFALPKIGGMLNAALADCGDERERRATMAFIIQGSYKLIQDWINEEAPPAADQQAGLILELAQRTALRRSAPVGEE